MLTHIHIENYTIIDTLDLDFDAGMTVLTGETGAGKSIIIGALGLVLGDRADSKVIRTGKDRCDVIVGFDLHRIPAAQQWLVEHELAATRDCLLRRTLNQEGRSKCFINGKPVPLQTLRELGTYLVSIHGQHEHQNLLKRDAQRDLLDTFAGTTILAEQVTQLAIAWRLAQDQLTTLENQNQEQAAKTDFLRYQVQELNELELTEYELEQLEQEHKQLINVENLLQYYQQIATLLEESEQANALNLLHRVAQILATIQQLNPKLSSTQDLLASAIIQLQEVANDIRLQLDKMDKDPNRLPWIEQRLQKIYDTARKHRIKPEALYSHHQALLQTLSSDTRYNEQFTVLNQRIAMLQQDYQTYANQLSASRNKAAQQLSEQITLSMQQLGMPGGYFTVKLQALAKPHLKGLEHVEFWVATNPGQEAQPLHKVVSGGELSRISLAIQVITAHQEATTTLIFDEVDVGIGGSTAAIVGQLLRKLGQQTQVLCITHLPQVAACGHQHYQVKKSTDQQLTYTQIQQLSQQARVQEIARMLGGLSITEQTLAHAKEMLATIT